MAPRIIIDFPNQHGQQDRRGFGTPQRVIAAYDHDRILPALVEIEADCEAGATAIGFLSYEAACAFDSALVTHPGTGVPLLWFALFEHERLTVPPTHADVAPLDWQIDITRAEYTHSIARIQEEIAAGTTYQVNFTTRMRAQFHGEALALYESLRRAQGSSGYHAYIETDDWCVLSLSPELFFEIDGRTIRTRPMKGTRARGRYLEEDERLAAELRGSAKERAENLMIVDLMRSDIGRVAEPGSVRVTSLYDVERYPTVHQLTSTVAAKLRAHCTLADILRALFPPGSVTGAPKISTMRLISELEKAPRGVYCGALGIVERSSATFNVPIRTLWFDRQNNMLEYGTGGGITTDSDPEQEYQELVTKALVVSQPWPRFALLETMRVQDGVVVRLARHLRRLRDSAEHFGIDYKEDEVTQALSSVVRTHSGTGRLRLLLDDNGGAHVELHALEHVPDLVDVALADAPVSSSDRFLFHKTTYRATYDRHLRQANGVFDVLLWNERDEITEFTRGNVVLEIGDQRVTPARASGLLAGVFRGELLDDGAIVERVITRSELAQANRIWFINSVREWREARLV